MDFQKAEMAIKELLNYHKRDGKEKGPKPLFGKDSRIRLTISTKSRHMTSYRIPRFIKLKHSLYDEDTEICLLVRDPQRRVKDIVADQNLTKVKKVIGASKLKKKFPTYEDRRILCHNYQLFMADNTVVSRLPALLGKFFYKRRKFPIPIRIDETAIKEEVEEAMLTTSFYMSPGTCQSIVIGVASQSVTQIMDNLKIVVSELPDLIPHGVENVRALLLSVGNSVGLAFYASVSPATNISQDEKFAPQQDPMEFIHKCMQEYRDQFCESEEEEVITGNDVITKVKGVAEVFEDTLSR